MYRNILNKKGFTLIELLVVISIISMLASVVLASVNNARAKSKISAGKTFANHTRSGLFDEAILLANFDSAIGCSDLVANNFGKGKFSSFCNMSYMFIDNDTTLKNSGKYLRFEGSNPGALRIQDSTGQLRSTFLSNNFTISTWYKPIPGGMSCNGDYCLLIGSSGNAIPVAMWVSFNSKTINAKTATAGTVVSTSLPSTTEWTHITFSATPTVLQLYINGRLESTVPYNSPAYIGSEDLTTMLIGGGAADYAADGYYDDVAVFGRALIAGEVEQIYAQGLENRKLANN